MLPKNNIHLLTNGTVLARKPEMLRHLFAAGLNDLIIDEYEAAPGTSYIVSLVFKNNFYAQEWAKARGYKKAVKEGKKTTVIRME